MRRMLLMVLVGWASAACAARPGTTAGAAELAGSLEVEVANDTAWLTLSLTNAGSVPVRLDFASSQRFDFAVRTLAGESLWTWSADKSFAQVTGSEVVPAGGTLTERVAWPVAASAGEYVAIGRLEALPQGRELAARFRVPGE